MGNSFSHAYVMVFCTFMSEFAFTRIADIAVVMLASFIRIAAELYIFNNNFQRIFNGFSTDFHYVIFFVSRSGANSSGGSTTVSSTAASSTTPMEVDEGREEMESSTRELEVSSNSLVSYTHA